MLKRKQSKRGTRRRKKISPDAEYEHKKQEKREEQHQKDLDKKEQKKLKEEQRTR